MESNEVNDRLSLDLLVGVFGDSSRCVASSNENPHAEHEELLAGSSF
jgi:hypothetical protein